MITCKDCIHWKKYDSESLVKIKGDYVGECEHEKFVYTDHFKTPQDGLGYWDYESYSAYFETGQDFGCIHGERREHG